MILLKNQKNMKMSTFAKILWVILLKIRRILKWVYLYQIYIISYESEYENYDENDHESDGECPCYPVFK